MKNFNSFYNNELITGMAILSVLHENKILELSKALLIHPILSYKGIAEFVGSKKTKVRSIEELIVKKSIAFTNFNSRYYESLELSINSILLFKQMGLLSIQNNKLMYIENDFDLYNKNLGKHALEVINASFAIADIIKKEDASDLYLSLRIEL